MLKKFFNCLFNILNVHKNVIGSYLLTIYARKFTRTSKKKAHFLRSNLLEQEYWHESADHATVCEHV